MLCGTWAIVRCQLRARGPLDELAVDEHLTLAGLEQAHEQIKRGALAGASTAHQPDAGSLRNCKRHPVQYPRLPRLHT